MSNINCLLIEQTLKDPIYNITEYLGFIYKDNCELLTPTWLVVFFVFPNYFYLIANSGVHFLIMIERVRATIFIGHYENQGKIYVIRGILLVWLLSIIYTIYIICSALADNETFGKPMGIAYLTSKYNSTIILFINYLVLFIATITTIFDFFVYHTNKKIKKRNKTSFKYSLSANYQLNENLLLIRYILPLDASYALFFGIYLIIVVLVRIYRDVIGDVNYISFYSLASMVKFFIFKINYKYI
ncbi:hypothetical protein Mgra_00008138 [Meloidogyne graminicola]|uniref:Uncharacterized protein n=1 Tax=Meloidogyne graminicola TaxID=189291 RepID=A0A8S9ZGK0_9BILA|nr:hypothetical protein Mgra_00008138 [Meloidogyne graminicola]